MQGRPKGGKNKYWTKEEKLKIIKEMINENLSAKDIERKYHIHHSTPSRWFNEYEKHGESVLEPKNKPGNPLCKYSNKKSLSDLEQLQYENMKLRIENERLKKGYLVKGDGSIVIFKK